MRKLLYVLAFLAFLVPGVVFSQDGSSLLRTQPLYRTRDLLPSPNGTQALGSSSYGWNGLWLNNGSGFSKIYANSGGVYASTTDADSAIFEVSNAQAGGSAFIRIYSRDLGGYSGIATDNSSLVFYLTGTSSPRMVLHATNGLYPYYSGGIPLGTPTAGWSALYLSDGTVSGKIDLTKDGVSNALTITLPNQTGTAGKLQILDDEGDDGLYFYIDGTNNAGGLATDQGILYLGAGSSGSTLYSVTSGAFAPASNNTRALGTSTAGWTKIYLASPDGSVSECSVDNSDNFTCTGL